jgi:anti-sigma B factor antagonist
MEIAMRLTITTHQVPGAMVIQPQGPLEMEDATQLTDRVIAVLASTKPREILVDMEAVPSIDDAGVSALVSGYDKAVARQATLTVVAPQPAVRRQLHTRGLDDLMAAQSR